MPFQNVLVPVMALPRTLVEEGRPTGVHGLFRITESISVIIANPSIDPLFRRFVNGHMAPPNASEQRLCANPPYNISIYALAWNRLSLFERQFAKAAPHNWR
jgi:hypothetical protein